MGEYIGKFKELVDKFVALQIEKDAAQNMLEEINNSISNIERQLLDAFSTQGLSSVRTDYGKLVYKRRDIYFSVMETCKKSLINELKSMPETKGLVEEHVNSQRLSAWAREQAKEVLGESYASASAEGILNALPAPVQRYGKISDKFSLRVS